MRNTVFIILLTLVGTTSCENQQSNAPEMASANQSDESTDSSVKTLIAEQLIQVGQLQEKEVANNISCSGHIHIPPTDVNAIHAKINGQVTYLKYLPGDYIKKGTLIARIEHTGIIEKQRQLLETKANLKFAESDFQRKKALFEGRATPEKTFEASQNQFELLKATYNGLKTELELIGVNIDQLEKEGKFQSSIPIYASTSGYVHKVGVNLGQMITPQTCLMEVANLNHLHVELQVQSKDIGAIQRGQKVRFTIPNRKGQYTARIEKINPMVDSEVSTLQVHCHIEHPDKKAFVPGLYVNATILGEPKKVKGLPLDAVIKQGEQYFAYFIQGEEAVKKPLQAAQVQGEFVVMDEMENGNWVVKGAYYLE